MRVGNSGKAIRATLKALPTTLKGSKYSKSLYMELMALLYDLLAKVLANPGVQFEIEDVLPHLLVELIEFVMRGSGP